MADWHVSIGGQQQSPMPEANLVAMIRSGQVSGQDAVWKDGMANWAKVAEIPQLAAALPGAGPMLSSPGQAGGPALGVVNYQMPGMGPVQCTERAIQALRGTKPWVRFIGVFFIVIGALAGIGGVIVMVVLSGSRTGAPAGMGIAYLIMAGLYLALGMSLNTYASKIAALLQYRREDHLEGALESQKSFWRLAGIMLLVVLGLYVLLLLIALFVGLSR